MLAVLLASALMLVQAAPGSAPPSANALIVGRVVDGAGERPISNVVVTLIGEGDGNTSGRANSGPPAPRVVTDSAGRFVFHSLRPGRYTFQVSGPSGSLIGGYGMRRPGGPAQPLDLAVDERMRDVTVRVWRPASITGAVTDQFGEPVAETRVTALRVTILGGARRLAVARTTITDDRGVFHLSRLEAGEYTVYLPFSEVTVPKSVQAASDTASNGGPAGREQFRVSIGESGAPDLNNDGVHIGESILIRTANSYGGDGALGPMLSSPPPDDDGRLRVYPLTYYPGVTSLADAATFALDSGQERTNIDLQAHLVSAMRVSGRIVGPEGPVPMIGVRLVAPGAGDAADESLLEAASTITDANGDFAFLGVPPGQYTLKAARVPIASRPPTSTSVSVGGLTMFTSIPDSELPPIPLPEGPTLGGSMALGVSDRDLNDLTVLLASGPRVTGRLEYEGTAPHLTEDQLLRAAITFQPIDGRSFVASSGRGQFDATGHFKTRGLLPGKYVVRVSGALGPWSLASVKAGDRDIADVPLVIDARDVSDVVLTLTDHQSLLTGTVRSQGRADPNAITLAFSTDRSAWTNSGATSRRLRSGRASAQGSYTIDNLPPGDYFVIAIDDKAGNNWQDPKRLDGFARSASRVTISPGEKHVQDLTTETVR